MRSPSLHVLLNEDSSRTGHGWKSSKPKPAGLPTVTIEEALKALESSLVKTESPTRRNSRAPRNGGR